MDFFCVLTLGLLAHTATIDMVVTVTGPATRDRLYAHVRQQAIARFGPVYSDAPVVFFTAEPNTLGT